MSTETLISILQSLKQQGLSPLEAVKEALAQLQSRARGATTDNTATNAEEVADAEVRLTTTETADSLRNAPEFRTLDDQAADAGTTGTMAPTDGTTTSSTDN